jgi:molybdopterin-dependent oxidoreductase alpha subunit
MSEQDKVPNAENPEKFTGIRVTKAKTVAAGIPAVVSSAKHILNESGLVRGMTALLKLNQKDGIVCPSCAWPEPDDDRSSIAEFCENGVKAIAEEATTKRLTPEFFVTNSVEELSKLSDYEIGKKGRLAQPMYLAKGSTHYQPVSWDDAFKKIAYHLKQLALPDEAIFYTSGRTSNEAAFLYQLFVREYGTNNLPDCSNMCHESSGVALVESVGIGKGSVTLEDFYQTEVIIILGQNPGSNHPRMLNALQKAKKNGAVIIAINPLPETGLIAFNNPQTLKGALGINTKIADLFLQVKINGDMALLKAIQKLLIEEESKMPGMILDSSFIGDHTKGYQDLVRHLDQYSIPQLSSASGISIEQIVDAAKLIMHKRKIIACWAMGLTQQKNAVDTIKEIVNLLLLKGSIGKPGAGTCPVRGHSNVQGDRTMGINERPSIAFLNSIKNNFGFQPPLQDGYDTVGAIHAMHDGRAKVFIAMGGNFLSSAPDTTYTSQALRKCKLTVHISTKLNRSHLVHGREALILPTLARSDRDIINGVEQFVSCENSTGIVQSSRGRLKPVSDNLLSEPIIVCRLAKAVMANTSTVNWELFELGYDHIRDAIEKTVPGFEDFNKKIRKPGGFYLPNSAREGKFNTFSGKAIFNLANIPTELLADDELMMMTIRSHDQFNTTIYGLNDRYRGVLNERRVVFLNEKDITKAGLNPGDVVDLHNFHDGIERIARKFIIVPFSIPLQCAATYFPEANVLVPINSVADKSNTPTSKMVVIKIRKHV